MGCVSVKPDINDVHPTVFHVINVNEQGARISPGQLEVTATELILYQCGKAPTVWPLRALRKYGFDHGVFSFECGRRCPTGEGIYAFQCRKAEQLFSVVQQQLLRHPQPAMLDEAAAFAMDGVSVARRYAHPATDNNATVRSTTNPHEHNNNNNNNNNNISSSNNNSNSVAPEYSNTGVRTVSYINMGGACADSPSHLYVNVDKEQSTPEADGAQQQQQQTRHCYANVNANTDTNMTKTTTTTATTKDSLTVPISVNGGGGGGGEEMVNAEQQLAAVSPVSHLSAVNYAELDLEQMATESSSSLTSTTVATVPATTTVTTVATATATAATTDPSCDEVVSNKADCSKRYATIDFQRTNALQQSVNPATNVEEEGSRKTRHNSTICDVSTNW